MLIHGFDMHRAFISTPGDLQCEQQACRAAIGEVNEKEAMPQKNLLVSVGLPHDDQIVGYRAAVADNVRQCTFFIQVFQDDWGPKNLFRKMLLLAADCRDDSNLPMRDVVIFLKDAPHETDPEILAFRNELESRQDMLVFRFKDCETLKSQVADVCGAWVRGMVSNAAAG